MIKCGDLEVGTRLLCIKSDTDLFTFGSVYAISLIRYAPPGGIWPYRINHNGCSGVGRGMLINLDELNGVDTKYNKLGFVLETSLSDEEIFIMRMSGKIPGRFHEED